MVVKIKNGNANLPLRTQKEVILMGSWAYPTLKSRMRNRCAATVEDRSVGMLDPEESTGAGCPWRDALAAGLFTGRPNRKIAALA